MSSASWRRRALERVPSRALGAGGAALVGGIACAFVLPIGAPRAADIVLNELMYDPPGTDAGAEYVELFNPTTTSLPLAGCALAFVNGTDPERPTTFWTAAAGLELAAGGFFVVGGAQVPEADAIATMSLQNGPDAVWLLRDGQPIDRIAYGATAPGGEGAPAPDASSASIGRVPDGHDSDDNAADVQLLPTRSPGAPNAREMLFRSAKWRVEPPWRAAAGPLEVEVQLIAEGFGAHQSAPIVWRVDARELARDQVTASRGDTVSARVRMDLADGDHLVQLSGDPQSPAAVEAVAVPVAIGPGLLALNEIMARPASGQPEWIELICRAEALDLTGWAIADATRLPRAIRLPPRLRAGDLALVAADSMAVRALAGVPAGVPCLGVEGGWPSLNNSPASGSEIADEVLLFDPLGRVVDHLAFGDELLSNEGRSIERGLFDAASPIRWYASPGPPTPGRANLSAAVAPPDFGLRAEPNPFSPDGDGEGDVLHVLLHADAEWNAIEAEVLDLGGDRVLALGADTAGGTLRQWLWDGTDARGKPAPAGAYLVVVRASGVEHAAGPTWRTLIALGRRR